MIPWNHFGRKNVGFLYAIAHGAKLIYDTDDDNVPLKSMDKFDQDAEEVLKIRGNSDLNTVNIYNLFNKQGKIWPRGIPLEDINKKVSFKW